MGLPIDYERQVLRQLSDYRRNIARMRILEKTPIGYGMSLDAFNDDDKLQDLHRKLKSMPTYMYLTEDEQDLRFLAAVYMRKKRIGTKSQLYDARRLFSNDPEVQRQLEKIGDKIEKVLDTRSGYSESYEGLDGVVQRISELQDLQRENEQIDLVLNTLDWYKPNYGRLLKLRYVEGCKVENIAKEFHISEKTYERWRPKAILKYAEFSGIAEKCPV